MKEEERKKKKEEEGRTVTWRAAHGLEPPHYVNDVTNS